MADTIGTITSLPPQVQDIFMAEYQHVLAARIRRSFKLSFEDKEFIENTVEQLFLGTVKVADLEALLQKNITTKNVDIKKLTSDIIGLRLYPAASYFKQQGQDIETFLNYSGSLSDEYRKNSETLRKALAEEKAGTYNHDAYLYPQQTAPKIELAEDDEDVEIIKEDDLSEQARIIRLEKFFESGVGDALELENSDFLEDVNDELIFLLPDHPDLQKNLRVLLLNSKEVIGKENIELEDKPAQPLAENWLKDFFRVAGADSFDTLSIAKYIISSANAKKLSEGEQAKLRRFLTLYHNIHFFPTPFTAIPVDKWDIIPGARTSATLKAAPIVVAKAPVEKQPKWSVTSPATPPVTSSPGPKSADLIELEKMRDQYPVGSLERAAIEEEIKILK